MHKDFHGNKLITGEKERGRESGENLNINSRIVEYYIPMRKRERKFSILIWDYIHAILQMEKL